ncbi:MAG: histidine kinase [Bacteroidales bacterium]|jgi:signal transduction histidine kinase|nr:histidine kinase [Bacteroidales bacterium]
MLIQVALILSVVLQFGASILAIGLIRKTRFNISWILISTGFFLMAFRRLYELIELIGDNYHHETAISSWAAVLISLLIFIGTIYIRRIFNFQERINNLRKKNEAYVLSAIIRAEEKERQEFSKELHDGLGPVLSSIKMAISAINKAVLKDHNKKIINKTEQIIDEAIITVKEISNKLNPHILENFGLEKAIKSFMKTLIIGKESEIKFLSNTNGKRYDYNTEVIIYRIVGELLTNTLKHASATSIDISLHDYESKLELFYSDNGIGFDINRKTDQGMGLSNIRSRVKSIDGKLEIKSKPKKGLFIKLNVPI